MLPASSGMLPAASRVRLKALAIWALEKLRHLSGSQWASLLALLVALLRSRLELQCALSGIADRVLGRSVRKDFLEEGGASRDRAKFSEFQEVLPPWLLEGLKRQSFQEMKPIQRQVLPLALAGRDVVATAPTGSGKTLAFLVPALVHAAGQAPPRVADGPIALVLAPTRELVIQIFSVAEKLTSQSPSRARIQTAAVYGGTRKMDQLANLRRQRCMHLLVATVGRLLDILRDNAFTLRRCSFLVLDEGDRMLDDGFEEEVSLIGSQVRKDKQVLFFSATWPAAVERAAKSLCRKTSAGLCRVAVEQENDDRQELLADPGLSLPPCEIQQVIEVLPHGNSHTSKLEILLRHLREEELNLSTAAGGGKALIFVRTRNAADELAALIFQEFGQRSGAIHGMRRQEQREAALEQFRRGYLRALVTTDVLGRGVDIPEVSLVFIYDFPDDLETYVHRVGRTGRNGARGRAVSLFEPRYWNGYLARELQELLAACNQEVPMELLEAARPAPALRQAPALRPDDPPMASAEELGRWQADGSRVWSYSANGGQSEQARLEFRAQGCLRTTWGWGDWTRDGEHMSVSWSGVTDVLALVDNVSFELVSRDGRPANTFKKKTFGYLLRELAALE
ncbi:unnamed protein product, partial [Effrenium voratum]